MSYVPKPMFEAGLAVEYFKNQHAKRAFRTDADRDKDQTAINRVIALYNYCEERNAVLDANTSMIREYEELIRGLAAQLQALRLTLSTLNEEPDLQARIKRHQFYGNRNALESIRAASLEADWQREQRF